MSFLKRYIVFLFLLVAIQVSATDYYVSQTDGNDSRTSTQAQNSSTPWKTLAKINPISFGSNDRVFFKRGDVWQESLTNGSNGVVWDAYGSGALPRFEGWQTLTTWTNLGSNIWEASLSSGTKLNMVTVNGVIQAMGRFPNTGTFLYVDSHTFTAGSGNSTGTITDAALTGSWSGAEFVHRAVEWVMDRWTITGQAGTVITYSNPWDTYPATDGNGYFIQNSLAACNAQNEWFYDAAASKLKMYSTVNPATLNVKASVLDRFANFQYRDGIEFHNLNIVGFDIEAINVLGSSNIKIINNEISYTGVDAINVQLVGGLIEGNIIRETNNSSIRGTYSDHTICRGNIIRKSGLIAGLNLSNNQQMDGIIFEQSDKVGNIAEGNDIDSVGYCGITMRGDSFKIRNNRINNFCMTVSDGGGAYTNGDNRPAREITGNIITNGIGNPAGLHFGATPGGAIGVYTDDLSFNVKIHNNTIAYCSRTGILLHNSQNMDAQFNNIFRCGNSAILIAHDGLGPDNPSRNINFSNNVIVQEAGVWIMENGSLANDFHLQFSAINNNKYLRPGTGDIFTTNWGHWPSVPTTYNNYTLTSWRSAFPAYDAASSTVMISADNNLTRLEYNSTASTVTRSLPGVYVGTDGTVYSGSANVPAHSSRVLLYSGAIIPPENPPIIIKGRLAIAP